MPYYILKVKVRLEVSRLHSDTGYVVQAYYSKEFLCNTFFDRLIEKKMNVDRCFNQARIYLKKRGLETAEKPLVLDSTL